MKYISVVCVCSIETRRAIGRLSISKCKTRGFGMNILRVGRLFVSLSWKGVCRRTVIPESKDIFDSYEQK